MVRLPSSSRAVKLKVPLWVSAAASESEPAGRLASYTICSPPSVLSPVRVTPSSWPVMVMVRLAVLVSPSASVSV